MALESLRTLAQLRAECVSKNCSPTIVGKERKEDYIRALRSYNLKIKYPNGIPWDVARVLEIDCPMLCRRYAECKESEQQEFFREGSDWIAEEKIDGNRMLIFYNHKENKFSFYSRGNSVVDYLPISYTDHILVDNHEEPYEHSFIIDSEIICTNPNLSTEISRLSPGTVCATQLQSTTALLSLNASDSLRLQQNNKLKFIVFDCLYFDNWILNSRWIDRRPPLKEVLKWLSSVKPFDFELNVGTHTNKKEFYDSIIDRGGEGVVFKNINSPYIATTSRSRTGWIKIKRSMNDTFGDNIDGWISGWTESDPDKGNADKIGGFEVSVKVNDNGVVSDHVIACISGISQDIRNLATVNDENGVPKLNPDFYGRVVEINGQGISARSMRLRHAVLLRFRPDKDKSGCEVLDMNTLRSLIM